ncbi:response regulator transcription factor [Clostridium aminobutyricum]|uniref:Stage 0 sporulation protein A homolog n=1 Tax=Clostridium aminobutyricum TaxID=33953 RepID=A0A939IFX8_CLOAM|nr:response regulator transcription factor [Clostridium aminobutyricum]MBN7772120.1 response regulator transcription factor [Clostridium aminobutyricum]
MNYKVLIVEDDAVISSEIKKYLLTWGYQVECVSDFHQVTTQFAAFNPHLVLMDVTLPFYNGYHWCSEIRKLSQVPIMFISSANDKMNIVMAMNMGGDDFIAKPFSFEVLLAKIQAMLRRTYSFYERANLVEHRGVVLNLSNASLEIEGQKVELTKNEFRILQLLFENKGRIVSREIIMKSLWDSDCFIDDNTLAVNFTRLRKKLDECGLKDFITTKKGIGYILEG